MLRWLSQTLTVSALSVRTIPQRLSSSAVAVIGIAGVVIVFVAVLSIGEGFKAAMADAGSPSRAIVLRSGADSEMTSGFPGGRGGHHEAGAWAQARRQSRARLAGAVRDGGRQQALDRHGRQRAAAGRRARRDAGPGRSHVSSSGRMFQFGTNEAIVGRSANRQFTGVDLGSEYVAGNLQDQDRRHLRRRRLRVGNRNLVRQPAGPGRLSARQLVPVACSPRSTRPRLSTRSRTG